MKTPRCGFTLVEALVVASVVVLLAAMVLPAMRRAKDEDVRSACNGNLTMIVKACITYQVPNGDFFPAFMQSTWAGSPDNKLIPAAGHAGCDGTFQPMPSLAVLYPAYVDRVDIFGCPATTDQPLIAFQYQNGNRHTCFGFAVDPGQTGEMTDRTDPASFTGSELGTKAKCSYFYDELTNFRDIGPGQAIACDADGQTWLKPDGAKPDYPKNWTRVPRKPNHEGGQNVMYFDGHVKWMETVYCSRDPNDDIFCPQAGWDADTDAYLWDGVNARQPQQ
jgi:prepilin-type processing-associated H-X9-DG protein